MEINNLNELAHRHTGNFFARGVGGEPFAQTFLQVACIFTTVKKKRGSYDALT